MLLFCLYSSPPRSPGTTPTPFACRSLRSTVPVSLSTVSVALSALHGIREVVGGFERVINHPCPDGIRRTRKSSVPGRVQMIVQVSKHLRVIIWVPLFAENQPIEQEPCGDQDCGKEYQFQDIPEARVLFSALRFRWCLVVLLHEKISPFRIKLQHENRTIRWKTQAVLRRF